MSVNRTLPSRSDIRAAVARELQTLQASAVQPMPCDSMVLYALRGMGVPHDPETVRLCVLHIQEADDLKEIQTRLRFVEHRGQTLVFLDEWHEKGQQPLFDDEKPSKRHFFRAHCLERGIAIEV